MDKLIIRILLNIVRNLEKEDKKNKAYIAYLEGFINGKS